MAYVLLFVGYIFEGTQHVKTGGACYRRQGPAGRRQRRCKHTRLEDIGPGQPTLKSGHGGADLFHQLPRALGPEMASSDLLSQDEIDALLHGVDNGDVNTDNVSDGVARPFDFTRQECIDRGRMPTLDMINDRFARSFRISLCNMLRHNADIAVGGVQMMKFSDYLHSLVVPTCFNLIKINPLRGKALCVIDPKLVFLSVDNYFGGSGRHARIEGREFSPTEARVIQFMLKHALRDLEDAWKPVLPVALESLGEEDNPQYSNYVSPEDVVVVCSFQIELKGGSGTFYVVMPYAMLEPIRGLLNDTVHSDRSESADHWTAVLREEVKAAEVTLSCTLPLISLRLGDILKLKKGDIIPINHPDKITVVAEHVPLYRGSYGVYKGKKAITIQEIIKRPEISSVDYKQASAGGKV